MRSSHLHGTAGQAICPSAVLLRIEFTAPHCLQPASELLPHFSTLTRSLGRYLLLHLSEGRPWRVLPVILALWSPDFPHDRPFGLAARLSVLLACLFSGIRRDCQRLAAMRPPHRRKSPGPSAENTGWPADAVRSRLHGPAAPGEKSGKERGVVVFFPICGIIFLSVNLCRPARR